MEFGTRGMSKLIVGEGVPGGISMRVEGNPEGKFYADTQMQEEVVRFLLERLGFEAVKSSDEVVDVVYHNSVEHYECGGETVYTRTPVEELRLRAARLLRIALHKEERDDSERQRLREELAYGENFEESALDVILQLRKELKECVTSK